MLYGDYFDEGPPDYKGPTLGRKAIHLVPPYSWPAKTLLAYLVKNDPPKYPPPP